LRDLRNGWNADSYNVMPHALQHIAETFRLRPASEG